MGLAYPDRIARARGTDSATYQMSGGTAQYFNNIGYSYMLRGNLSEALKNFRKAQKLDPDNVVVANNIEILSRAAAEARA